MSRLPDYCTFNGVWCEVVQVKQPLDPDGRPTPLHVNILARRIVVADSETDQHQLLRNTAERYGVSVVIPPPSGRAVFVGETTQPPGPRRFQTASQRFL